MRHSTLPIEAVGEKTWDAVVLGAGPAGALAARQLAAGGARVLLVEKRRFPRWKVCGACLNGQALAVLRSVGLGDVVDDGSALPLNEFCVALGSSGEASRFPLPEGRAISRARLDSELVEAAIDAGSAFVSEVEGEVGESLEATRPVRLRCVEGRQETTVQGRVVLVAAGLASRCLERDPTIRTQVRPNSKIGAGCVVDAFPRFYQEGSIFMAVGRWGYVGLVRVEDGSLNVAAAFDKGFLKASGSPARAAVEVLAEAGFPAIPELETVQWQGTGGLTRRTTPIARRRLFLLGDSTGYVEPFTGEGMGWALASGRAVVPLALRGIDCWHSSLEQEWTRLHRRLIGRRQRFCRWLSTALRHPRAARIVLETAARVPRISGLMIRHLNHPPLISPMS